MDTTTGNLSPQMATALMQAREAHNGTLGRLKDAAASKDTTKLDDAARDFEAVFLSEMLKPMFETIQIDETFGGGKGEEIFRGVMIDQYGKLMAKAGGIGLASHVKEALIRAQGDTAPESKGEIK